MDQFGVLVEGIGFKAQGKSAPLADLKGKTKPSSINSSRSSYNSNSVESDLDGNFRSNNNGKPQNGGGHWDDYVDVFGGPVKASKPSGGTAGGDGGSMFDLDSIFKGSNNSSARSSVSHLYDDDIFGGMQGMKSSAAVNYDDMFGSMASPPMQSDSMGDLLGNFDGLGLKSNGPRKKHVEVEKKAGESDDLIPGFGDNSPPKNEPNLATRQHQQSSGHSANSPSNFAKDPFVVVESSSNSSTSGLPSDLFGKDTGKNSVLSSIDELEDFAMGRVRKNANDQSDVLFGDGKVKLPDSYMKENTNRVRIAREKRSADAGGSKKVSWEKTGAPAIHDVHKRQAKTEQDKLYHKQREKEEREREQRRVFESENELESFFSKGSHPSSATGPSATTVDPIFDILFQKEPPKVKQTFSGTGTSSGIKKSSSVTNTFDDFSFMFGVPSSGGFQEIEGESKERRKARLNHHLRTQARMAEALAEKNQRDFQIQQEQEEKHRLAEILDDDIKRWAAGKEGNLRALLSSLQHVLWPKCGWQPIPLTDLITSISVKKVYHKATLCVHPDKVQQKGASVQQKYIAEKVFDVLKEAWNKFNSEELR